MFPPTRIIVSGNDPLRDISILYTLKMASFGVNVQIVDYRYQMHGFIMFSKGPISFKESYQAIDKIIGFVTELAQLPSES